MGVEPTYAAWEAAVLPMNYTRERVFIIHQNEIFVKLCIKIFRLTVFYIAQGMPPAGGRARDTPSVAQILLNL